MPFPIYEALTAMYAFADMYIRPAIGWTCMLMSIGFLYGSVATYYDPIRPIKDVLVFFTVGIIFYSFCMYMLSVWELIILTVAISCGCTYALLSWATEKKITHDDMVIKTCTTAIVVGVINLIFPSLFPDVWAILSLLL